jgi:hypothetical protein
VRRQVLAIVDDVRSFAPLASDLCPRCTIEAPCIPALSHHPQQLPLTRVQFDMISLSIGALGLDRAP